MASYVYNYTGAVQEFTVPETGRYVIECWGAYSSGRLFCSTDNRSCGGYTKGTIVLSKDEILYLYIGATGQNFNYGTQAYSNSAGGATDVRLIGGAWNDATSLRSRIMVAAGAGGQGGKNNNNSGDVYGGSGGGLEGQKGGNINTGQGGAGATQTTGYAFGYAGGGNPGGNGYYSGQPGYYGSGVAGAGGGSSFISGHEGCNAIAEDGTHTGHSIHYSGKYFTNTAMYGGNDYILHPESGVAVKGYEGNGVIKITYAGPISGSDYKVVSTTVDGPTLKILINKVSNADTLLTGVAVNVNNVYTYAKKINEYEYEIDLFYCCKTFGSYEADITINYKIILDGVAYDVESKDSAMLEYNRELVLLSENSSAEDIHNRLMFFKDHLQTLAIQLKGVLNDVGYDPDLFYTNPSLGVLINEIKQHMNYETVVELTSEYFVNNATLYNCSGSVDIITDGYNKSHGISITGRPNLDAWSSPSSIQRMEMKIDLTFLDRITFYAMKGAQHGMIIACVIDDTPAKIDGSTKTIQGALSYIYIHYNNAPTSWSQYELDTSLLTGEKKLIFFGGYFDTSGNAASNTKYSKIELHYNLKK